MCDEQAGCISESTERILISLHKGELDRKKNEMKYAKMISVVLFGGRPVGLFVLLFFSVCLIFFSDHSFIRQNKHD